MRLVFDTEANGLLHDTEEFPAATTMHCIVTKDIDNGAMYKFYGDTTVPGDHGSIAAGISYLQQAEELIGHNIIRYDVPLIKKLFGVQLKTHMVDTLVLSKVLNSDRQLPKGCPGSIPNPITGKNDRIGPHSLASWGYRVGRFKPEFHAWDKFTMEMLHRCSEDVEINLLVYYALLNELAEIMPS